MGLQDKIKSYDIFNNQKIAELEKQSKLLQDKTDSLNQHNEKLNSFITNGS